MSPKAVDKSLFAKSKQAVDAIANGCQRDKTDRQCSSAEASEIAQMKCAIKLACSLVLGSHVAACVTYVSSKNGSMHPARDRAMVQINDAEVVIGVDEDGYFSGCVDPDHDGLAELCVHYAGEKRLAGPWMRRAERANVRLAANKLSIVSSDASFGVSLAARGAEPYELPTVRRAYVDAGGRGLRTLTFAEAHGGPEMKRINPSRFDTAEFVIAHVQL
jgi:hypothetical protein